MFSRISYDSFQLLFPVIGFFIFASVFAGAVIRVYLMKKPTLKRLSLLPLDDAEEARPTRRHEESR